LEFNNEPEEISEFNNEPEEIPEVLGRKRKNRINDETRLPTLGETLTKLKANNKKRIKPTVTLRNKGKSKKKDDSDDNDDNNVDDIEENNDNSDDGLQIID
jgi:hypothetical protein